MKILIACVGNIFLGDDGFGVEVARRLAFRMLPSDVVVKDFGIRGFDLTYALMDPYDITILVDACARSFRARHCFSCWNRIRSMMCSAASSLTA